jgi:protein-arginine kinase activator protein McsA
MLRHFDFQCTECDLTSEHFVDHKVKRVTCQCGAIARRILSVVRIDKSGLSMLRGASPESIAHFDRIHRQQKTIEERTMREHGDYGKAPGSD